MGKSIRSKIKRKFRSIKREKNHAFESDKLKERYVSLKVHHGEVEADVRAQLAEDMEVAAEEKKAASKTVDEKRMEAAQKVLDGTMEVSTIDLGEDEDHPLGQNLRSSRRTGPRGRAVKTHKAFQNSKGKGSVKTLVKMCTDKGNPMKKKPRKKTGKKKKNMYIK